MWANVMAMDWVPEALPEAWVSGFGSAVEKWV